MKKFLSTLISVVLAVTLCVTTCTSAFAATFNGKKYVKEMIISYGKTEEEAKKWLTDNDYEVIDNNLNDGADDILSTKRAVYVGYKTTDDADEAITDMKVMNMKGGYSVQDYQMILEEQEANIELFFYNFKAAIKEYRTNYAAKQERAVVAHDMLNMLYDDDTKQNMGDLLLNKVREEYTDKQYNTLTNAEKAKVGDMTTILMQANSSAILVIEQLVAMATDKSAAPWINRYQSAKTYDGMVDELVEKRNYTITSAVKKLATLYDQDAQKIAGSFSNYKEYLGYYLNADISFDNTVEEIEAYQKANEDFDYAKWFALGSQLQVIKAIENDGVSLYDLIFSDEYDVENTDRYMLYPLVSVLSDGQRACLDFLPMYQLVALGINDDSSVKAMNKIADFDTLKEKNISIYDGIDRTVFGGDVAVTGEAYKLQNSTGKDPVTNWTESFSDVSYIFAASFAASVVATCFAWGRSAYLNNVTKNLSNQIRTKTIELSQNEAFYQKYMEYGADEGLNGIKAKGAQLKNELDGLENQSKSVAGLAKVYKYIGVATTCLVLVLAGLTAWNAYQDLKAYYTADFTPIPMHMVNQGVGENDEKVYTYYTAVKCNREAQGMVTDSNKLLEDYGDLNGDVGKQWVALYTTKDKSAGNPITTDFAVQFGNSNIPADSTPLSIFCESTAQNLTNKKAGYTYADSNNGVYLFYCTDESAFAGSAISTGIYALIGGAAAIIVAAAGYFVGKATEKKTRKKENKNA